MSTKNHLTIKSTGGGAGAPKPPKPPPSSGSSRWPLWVWTVGAAAVALAVLWAVLAGPGGDDATVLRPPPGAPPAAAEAATAALLRERLATVSGAKERGDWAAALAALTADLPQEPFPGAFQEEPLKELLAQLAALKNTVEAGQKAAQIEAHLATARAATEKKDWPAVLVACDKVLALDADNAEAKALRAEAKKLQEDAKSHQLRFPVGYRLVPGAGPETYTNTGWAAAVIHEKSGIELVYIPAGSFTMGSPANEAQRRNDETQHQVTLSQGFYMGKTEVTQAQWQKLMGKNPSYFQNAGMDAPVEQVSWDDCQEFCRKAGSGLRLPTEAQWEYACRAGTTGDYAGNLDEMAWYDKNSGSKTHPVGTKKANPWGLYDMHGNVWEWCQDWYGTYPTGAVRDPTGAAGGSYRVSRGGGWGSIAGGCRSASRGGGSPSGRGNLLGFRLVRTVP